MPGEFWTSVGDKLADRLAAASVPALVFWFGGLVAWVYGNGGLHKLGEITNWLDKQSAPALIVATITVIVGITATGMVVDRFAFPALRLLEGYWPQWLEPVQRRLVTHQTNRAEADDQIWQELYKKTQSPASANANDLAAFARLDQARRRHPSNPNRYMPTRIGNILRAAETSPTDKYGLDAVAVWPRLWLILPDTARQELTTTRNALDSSVSAAIWGLLFCGFAPWTLIAIPVGLGTAITAIIMWVPNRASLFGDLLEAAFDLNRKLLYQELRWPLPATPKDEKPQGERLSSYLWRGSEESEPEFTPLP